MNAPSDPKAPLTVEQAHLQLIAARAESVRRWMDTDTEIPRNLYGLQRALDAQRGDVAYLLVQLSKRDEALTAATRLIGDLTDRDICCFDHHGGCQAHGYLELKPGETCPQQEAKEWATTKGHRS